MVALLAAGMLAASCSRAALGPEVTTTSAAPATTTAVLPPATTTTAAPPPTTTTTTTAAIIIITTTTTTTTTTVPPPTTTTTTAPERGPVTPEDPLRVWVIGDSLAGGVGYALGARGRATGLIVTSVHGEGGTGLVRPDVFDWPVFVAENRREADPDVVVVILGANDGQAMASPHHPAEFGSPEWDAQYAALVDAFSGQLLEFASRVYWVSIPIMADPGYDYRVRHVNRILLHRAGLRFAVRYVDAYTLFQDRRGNYAMEIIENGVPVKVRADDGIHFSPEGADRLARLLMRILEEDWLPPPAPAG